METMKNVENIDRNGRIYRIKRDEKGQFAEVFPLKAQHLLLSVGLVPKKDERTHIREEELIRLFQKWLRDNVPSIKRDGVRWYQIRRSPPKCNPLKRRESRVARREPRHVHHAHPPHSRPIKKILRCE